MGAWFHSSHYLKSQGISAVMDFSSENQQSGGGSLWGLELEPKTPGKLPTRTEIFEQSQQAEKYEKWENNWI